MLIIIIWITNLPLVITLFKAIIKLLDLLLLKIITMELPLIPLLLEHLLKTTLKKISLIMVLLLIIILLLSRIFPIILQQIKIILFLLLTIIIKALIEKWEFHLLL
jgi:hypothetical protein